MITKNRIAQIKSLSQKKNRVELSQFVAEGLKMLSEMLNSNFNLIEIYYLSDIESDVMKMINGKAIDTIKITPDEMKKISQLKTPASVLVVAQIPENVVETYEGGFSIALDSVQDPGNMGTIVRIADWFGVKNIFCSMDCADIYSPKVVQAAMGAIARVDVEYLDLEVFLSKVKVPIYGTFLEGENIYSEKLTQSSIIVMGNEGKGISKGIEKYVTNKITIPSFVEKQLTSESLNVGVAAAICVSEFKRR